MSFLTKNDELLEKHNEIWKKSAIASKKNLIVILYIMKKNYKEKNQYNFNNKKYQKETLSAFVYQ